MASCAARGAEAAPPTLPIDVVASEVCDAEGLGASSLGHTAVIARVESHLHTQSLLDTQVSSLPASSFISCSPASPTGQTHTVITVCGHCVCVLCRRRQEQWRACGQTSGSSARESVHTYSDLGWQLMRVHKSLLMYVFMCTHPPTVCSRREACLLQLMQSCEPACILCPPPNHGLLVIGYCMSHQSPKVQVLYLSIP